MKKLLAALAVGVFALVHSPTFAQDKKSEPANEEVKKADTKKDDKSEVKKAEAKKKIKKGGC